MITISLMTMKTMLIINKWSLTMNRQSASVNVFSDLDL